MATVSSLLNYLGALPQSYLVVDEDDNDIALTVRDDRVVVTFPSDTDEAKSDQLTFFEPHSELSELAAKAPDVVSPESRTDDPENFKEPERSEDPLDDDPKSPGNRKQDTTSISPDSATHTPKESVDGTDVSKNSKDEETKKAAKEQEATKSGTHADKKSETMKDEPSKTHNQPPQDKSSLKTTQDKK